MAFTQTTIKRTVNEHIIKLTSDATNLRSGLLDLKGAASVFGSCTGTIKAYLPDVNDGVTVPANAGVFAVPVGDDNYREITGSMVASGHYFPCVPGDANGPLIIPGYCMPTSAYFKLAASSTAFIHIRFGSQ